MPASFAEGFEILAQHGVIDPELANELARVVGVRHRLAHGYAGVDLERLWSELPGGLDVLDRYSLAIARFVAPPAKPETA